MKIRGFQANDIQQIVSLFFDTVHSVNARDYTPEQLDVWAAKDELDDKLKSWKASMEQNITYIAELNGTIIGFSDMTHDGHLDRLYIHKDFQSQGIATKLVNLLVTKAGKLGMDYIDTYASITAKPFFEHHGFIVIQQQKVELRGVSLINYKMVKKLF
ncbi:GNAT family N-acetyltransferase [Neobacillus sp. PS3-40]|uniref:GNAT family N-acetyltransferase n=1 Tax=Neobacillus sp. PS3-40 TaxID=3070679 RepID=UPI0027DFD31D|nr:GNAT family N-acetyltransferase [Neobacillus sp. PS3-40]WML44501.1 GNAT family N-acetyltransferase [Neobacillus sp. PS3-40]